MEDYSSAIETVLKIVECYGTPESIASLEKALESKPNPFPKKPAKARCQLTAEDIKNGLKAIDEAEATDEWTTVLKVTQEMLDSGVTWIPALKGHFALAMLNLEPTSHNFNDAFEIAKESLDEYPLDYAAYVAIAILKFGSYQFDSALTWLRLATLCHKAPLKMIALLQGRMTYLFKNPNIWTSRTHQLLASPHVIEHIKALELDIDWEEFEQSMSEIGSDSEKCLQALQTNINLLKVASVIDASTDSRTILVFTSDKQKQSPCSTLTHSVIENISKYLDMKSVCNLRTTSRMMLALTLDSTAFQYAVASKYGVDPDCIPPQRRRLILPLVLRFVIDVAKQFLGDSNGEDEDVWMKWVSFSLAIDEVNFPLLTSPKLFAISSMLRNMSHLLSVDAAANSTRMLDTLESHFSILQLLGKAVREFPPLGPYSILSQLVSLEGPKGDIYTNQILEKGYFGNACQDLVTVTSALSFHALIVSREIWKIYPPQRFPFWTLERDENRDDGAVKKSLAAQLSGLWHLSMPWIAPSKAGQVDVGVFNLSVVEETEGDAKSQKPPKITKNGPKIEELPSDDEEDGEGDEEDGEDLEDEEEEIVVKLRGKGLTTASDLKEVEVLAFCSMGQKTAKLRLTFYSASSRLDVECLLEKDGRIFGGACWGEEEEEDLSIPDTVEQPEDWDDLFSELAPICSFMAWRDTRGLDPVADAAKIEEILSEARHSELFKTVSERQNVAQQEFIERYHLERDQKEALELAVSSNGFLRATLDGLQSVLVWNTSTPSNVEFWIAELSELCSSPQQLESASQFQLIPAPLKGDEESNEQYQLRLDLCQRFLYVLSSIRRGIAEHILLRSDALGSMTLLDLSPGDPNENVANTLSAEDVLKNTNARAIFIRWSQILVLSHDSLPNQNTVLYEILNSLHNAVTSLHESTAGHDDDQDLIGGNDQGTHVGGYTRISNHLGSEIPQKRSSKSKGVTNSNNTSLTTIGTIALAGATIAAISVGAFLFGRWIASPKKSTKQ